MATDIDFEDYVRARWHKMVRTAMLYGRSPQEAEDDVQTVLARCYASWHRIQNASSVDAYVYRSLANQVQASRRRLWRREIATAALPDDMRATDHAGEVTTRAVLVEALARLGQDARNVLVLRYAADLSESEVSDILGVPLGTVKSRTYRALKQLSNDGNLLTLREEGARHE